jgi:hypothetical protein
MAELKFLGYLAEIYGRKRAEISLESPRKLREILGVGFVPSCSLTDELGISIASYEMGIR